VPDEFLGVAAGNQLEPDIRRSGSAPLLEAASAWDGLAGELGSAATPFNSVTSGLAGASWQGAAAQAMTAGIVPIDQFG
jgi:PPE-repeat protein